MHFMTRLESVPCVELVTINDTTSDYFGALNSGRPDTVGTDINQAIVAAVADVSHHARHRLEGSGRRRSDTTGGRNPPLDHRQAVAGLALPIRRRPRLLTRTGSVDLA